MSKEQAPITILLRRWKKGEEDALDDLFPMVYGELYNRASGYLKRERKDHTLSGTALVNEAYIHLISERDRTLQNRNHFFALTATIMRHLLVRHAKVKNTLKRGYDADVFVSENLDAYAGWAPEKLLELDDGINALAQIDKRKAQTFELRFIAGYKLEEIAEILEISLATVKREVSFAQAWMQRYLRGRND